jgi:hypothetical protein
MHSCFKCNYKLSKCVDCNFILLCPKRESISTVVIRVWLPIGLTFSPLSKCPDWLWSHLASYQMDTRGPFLWVKQPEQKANHSPSSKAEVKNVCHHCELLRHHLYLYFIVLSLLHCTLIHFYVL